MSNEMLYYRIDLLAESGLSIGAADSAETDHDVALDSRGLPMIPATSLAGVYRSHFAEDIANAYFGSLVGDDVRRGESPIRVYDALWVGGNSSVSTRDSVSLENRVAVQGLKFDRQMVERGALFRTYIETRGIEDERLDSDIEGMISAIESGSLLFGSKATRGFGRLRVVSCLRRKFDLDDSADRTAWLDFDMFEETGWNSGSCEDLSSQIRELGAQLDEPQLRIELALAQRGALSVREYSTEPNRPDFGQLYIRDSEVDGEDVPVIPGTTWAGAFRDRYEAFGGRRLTEELFGFAGKAEIASELKTVTRKSRISFSESVVRDGEWKEITRNSIDRFTGGTKDGALFTMRTYFSGRTGLEMRIDLADCSSLAEAIEPLLAVIADLHNGFMSVGGLAAVGHGLFRVTGARLSVGSKNYEGFVEDLLGSADAEYAKPNVNEIADKISHLVASRDEGGSCE